MSTVKDRVLDILERAGSTAGEQFLAVVVTTTGGAMVLADVPWEPAIGTAIGAFIASILLTVVQYAIGAAALSFWVDTAVRVAKSFAASLLGLLGTDVVDVFHFNWVRALNLAAVAAFLTLAKCLFSPNAHLSGSLLPTPVVARIVGAQVEGGTFRKAA